MGQDRDQTYRFPREDRAGDALTEILRDGARQMLMQAVEAEVSEWIEARAESRDEQGRQGVVRNGYMPERELQTPLGGMTVQQPRVRDRRPEDEREKFSSKLLPPYLRRTKAMEELIPWLYLKGVSTGDFSEALQALLGPDAPGLSAPTITRLKETWNQEFEEWRKRSLAGKRYVYMWADGVYCNIRLEDEANARQCILVLMGATLDGRKELIAIADGYRESEQSWWELFTEVKARGLEQGPELAIGDGALGFWAALAKAFPQAQGQRCWVHKTANVLNKMPKSVQGKAKGLLHEIWQAPTHAAAEEAFDTFVTSFEAKYPKAVECLTKDREKLLTFYQFPAEHWKHLRTTNPIESTFATVRLRTEKTKGCGSRQASLTMVFKLAKSAEKSWRRLNGSRLIADVIAGVKFEDGEKKVAA